MDKPLGKMTEEEIAEARIKIDQHIQALREKKLILQREIDRRRAEMPSAPADFVIGIGG